MVFPLTQVHLVLATVAAGGGILVGTYKTAKPLWRRRPRPLKRVSAAIDAVLEMRAELAPNGGNSIRDVVDRVEKNQTAIDQRLSRAVAFMQRVARTVDDAALFELNAGGLALWLSDYWEELTGLGLHESLGFGWASGIYEEDRARVIAEFKEARAQQRIFRCAFRVLHVVSSTVTSVRMLAEPVFVDSAVVGWVGVITLSEEAHV